MRVKMYKPSPPAPTASTIGPCPTVICNERGDSKKIGYEAEEAKEYGKLNKRVQKASKKSKRRTGLGTQ